MTLLRKIIPHGIQPDGDQVPDKADGNAISNTTLLGGTFLASGVTDADTTIPVISTADFPAAGTIKVNGEIITYTGKDATNFTGCVRGAEQTTSKLHVSGIEVGGCFISNWIDSDGWSSIEVFVKSDTPSEFLGLQIQYTDDAQATTPTVRAEKRFTYADDDVTRGFEDIKVSTILDGFRIIYANAGITQTEFFLDVALRAASDNNRYNKGGALITANFANEVAFGLVSNYEIITKFGRVLAMDAVDAARDVWALADDAESPRLNTKIYPSTASEFFLASSSVSDTSVVIRVEYLSDIGEARQTSVNLNGQTPVSLGFLALDVNRMIVTSSTGAVGNIYCLTANNFSAGVPVTISQCVAFIAAGYNQTQQVHFTVPLNKRLLITQFNIDLSRSSGAAGSAVVRLLIKPNGEAVKIKREFLPTTSAGRDEDHARIVVESLSQITWRLQSVSDNVTNCVVNWNYELIDS